MDKRSLFLELYIDIKKGKETMLMGVLSMTKKGAWDYAIGLIKVDGLEPTDDFKKLVEKEINGEVTTDDLKRYLDKKYTVKGNC